MGSDFLERQKREYISLAIDHERQRQISANLYESMEILKTALEKIANLSTGESSRIACEALDSVYPIKGA
jgi:hypothetical protein